MQTAKFTQAPVFTVLTNHLILEGLDCALQNIVLSSVRAGELEFFPDLLALAFVQGIGGQTLTGIVQRAVIDLQPDVTGFRNDLADPGVTLNFIDEHIPHGKGIQVAMGTAARGRPLFTGNDP